jgi:hypothetical protein
LQNPAKHALWGFVFGSSVRGEYALFFYFVIGRQVERTNEFHLVSDLKLIPLVGVLIDRIGGLPLLGQV